MLSPGPPSSNARYWGALCFNILTFIVPAVYSTLSRLWVAKIDSSLVSVAETYTYIGTAVEVVNEGLPRAAYLVIGDRARRSERERIAISYALIIVQCVLGALLSVVICAGAPQFVQGFVPVEVRNRSVRYVRIGAFSSLSSTLDVAVTFATRALDRPDVPLLISTTKTLANIILDLIFLSSVRVVANASIETQAAIRLACDFAGALAGLAYFLWLSRRQRTLRLLALRPMLRPGAATFAESLVRNALYLWQVSGLVSLGEQHASAWAIFNAIRWGIVMVPANALEVTSATFVGHNWGAFRSPLQLHSGLSPGAQVRHVVRPAGRPLVLALCVEVPLCLFMSLWGIEPFARYLSQSSSVAAITKHMWRTIDWCYVFYGANARLASILLATKVGMYLAQSLASNLLWVLPWAIVAQVHGLKTGDPWKWYAIVLGGSMVFSTVVLIVVLTWWTKSTLRMARSAEGVEREDAELLAAESSKKSGPPSVPTLDHSPCVRDL